MTFVKWGMAAALALAISPAYADDQQAEAQKDITQAQQDAQKQKAEAQTDAAKKKADAQKQMADADREAREKSAKADEKANEKISDARKDEAKQGSEVRASQDRDQGSAATSSGDSKKAPLSATAKRTLQTLHSDSQMEIGMARIAKDKAQNDKVKDLASTIQDDHSKLDDKVSSIARDHGVELAAHGDMAKDQKHVEQAQKLEGAAFDKHYADMMSKEHRKDIDELRKVQPQLHANKSDADVAKLVDDTIKGLEKHEKLAVEAQTALKTDQRQGRRGSSGTSTSTSTGSSWPQTDADTSSGADTATGPHTGADTRDHGTTTGSAPGTKTQTPPSDNTSH